MPGLTCNACNSEVADETAQKLHYKSEWHRYNLKRKVAGVPGVTEALFLARQSALAEERDKSKEGQLVYECALCNKSYRSSRAHAEHLKSRAHSVRASQDHGLDPNSVGIAVVKPQVDRQSSISRKPRGPRILEDEDSESSGDEWEEVDPNEDLVGEASQSMEDLKMNENASSLVIVQEDEDEDEEAIDPMSCFMCDLKHKNLESCMVHMHKQHGFFIPDVEYLKHPEGLLTYVGLKVKRDYICLYCNDRCQPFVSLEAVRKHMEAKSHCKLRYGDDDDEEDAELEVFYDYSSSYMDEDGKQLIMVDDASSSIELSSGSELVITRKTESGQSTKTLGSREFIRYYRQKPRPSTERDLAVAISLASRYKKLGLATIQSKEQTVRLKILKEMRRSGVEAMRARIGMKSNIIRNLPKNVPY